MLPASTTRVSFRPTRVRSSCLRKVGGARRPRMATSRRTRRVIVSPVRDATNGVWTAEELAGLTTDFAEVFSGRTVLVTGADGFMGSHLTKALDHHYARVHAFVRDTLIGPLNYIVQSRRLLQ